MDSALRLIDRPAVLLAWIGGVAMALMMLHLTADVLMKYFFSAPIDGTLEVVASYYMVAVSFLPLAYVTHHEGHIKVELFTRNLPQPKVLRMEGVVGFVAVFYVGLMVIGGIDEAIRRTRIGDVVETTVDMMEIWQSRWMVPIGAGLMLVYLVWRIAADFLAAAGRRPPVEGGNPEHALE